MVIVRPFDDLSGFAVFQSLDPMDSLEAELVRGARVSALGLFAEWRAAEAGRVVSYVAFTGPPPAGQPFAVFGIYNTGQAGVGQAALLARDHMQFRRPLAQLALRIARELPPFAAERGIHRIEARSWSKHPTAATLLSRLGFAHEADMNGFGRLGHVQFRQFAWVSPQAHAPH